MRRGKSRIMSTKRNKKKQSCVFLWCEKKLRKDHRLKNYFSISFLNVQLCKLQQEKLIALIKGKTVTTETFQSGSYNYFMVSIVSYIM